MSRNIIEYFVLRLMYMLLISKVIVTNITLDDTISPIDMQR